MKIYVPLSMMNYSAPPGKGGKREKKKARKHTDIAHKIQE